LARTGSVDHHLVSPSALRPVEPLGLPQPQVLVCRAREKFNEELELTHERIRERVGRLLGELSEWTRRLAG